MTTKCYLFISAIILNGILNVGAFAQEHHHHAMKEQVLELNHGVKWPIDESLHAGMSSIRQHLMLNLDAIHYNKFSTPEFLALAVAFDQQLQFIFENCKLPPQADAQLHVLLAKIMRGNEMIKSAEDKKRGAVMILQALQNYPLYFDDQNWQDIVH